MPDFELIRREHVLKAISEYDELGSAGFRDTYGLAATHEYAFHHDGRRLDARAMIGVAHYYAAGQVLDSDSMADAKEGARVLQVLGFDVDGPGLDPLRYTNATTVGQEHARATWALAARERLVETAGVYHGTISFKELADFVQRRSLVKTTQLHMHWIGDVLGRVSGECARRGEPFLAALCVDARGHVGGGYVTAVEQHRGPISGDPDEHAAHERLDCYRHFGAPLPEGGGEPAYAPKPVAKAVAAEGTAPRVRASRAKAPAKPVVEEKPLVVCPVHFTVVPASGVCDMCD
ncbi:MAG TPA: hypothetical protein VFG72_07215 [Marmoricola sp.]|nr:hypothetical protein [Marmoricola sp.]